MTLAINPSTNHHKRIIGSVLSATGLFGYYTLCSEKNPHSRLLSYLRGKCLDFHKIFRECLEENMYSTSEKS